MILGLRGAIGRVIVAVSLLVPLAIPAAAQDEAALRDFFEGQRVTVTIDMPGTSDGVDVYVESPRPIDYSRHRDRLRASGTAIRADERTMVTLIKVKKDLIEFQLGGGGFGTFDDDSSPSVSIPPIEKGSREKSLEQAVKDEDNPRRRRELARELDELRLRREVENRRIEALRIEAQERRKERIAAQRLRGGSRFNLRYAGEVPRGITPRDVMAALGAYVDFASLAATSADSGPSSDKAGGPGGLRKGMTPGDAERVLGRPIAFSARQEGRLKVVTLVFAWRSDRIAADFVEDVLVRYVTTSR